MKPTGVIAIARRTILQLGRRPLYWFAMFLTPLFCIVFMTSEMREGLPVQAPAAIVDLDRSSMSRQITRTLGAMQMVDLTTNAGNFREACDAMKRGEIYGFFMIPRNFEKDVLAGSSPTISFYTNMTYYVPGTMLFKNFKTVAVYTKAGIVLNLLQSAGMSQEEAMAMVNPVNITARPIGNPELNYGIYLNNGFVPGILQVLIMLVTCYTIFEEVKRNTSPEWMRMAGGNVYKAIFGKMLPQTVWWWIMALFMEMWLFKYCHYPMHGSWFWLTLSELLYVLACQGFALLLCSAVPNLRFSLSICALTSILSFSLAAYSFPVQSMYPAVGILSYLLPARYNVLIYFNEALNGLDIYYSRIWFCAYILFAIAPLALLWRLRPRLLKPSYMP